MFKTDLDHPGQHSLHLTHLLSHDCHVSRVEGLLLGVQARAAEITEGIGMVGSEQITERHVALGGCINL